jgi:hypothetical protein
MPVVRVHQGPTVDLVESSASLLHRCADGVVLVE